MGLIVDDDDTGQLHGEARRESFVIFTDYGHDEIELLWSQFDDLKTIIGRLEEHRPPKEE